MVGRTIYCLVEKTLTGTGKTPATRLLLCRLDQGAA
jgi:hypothetical protein